MAVHKKQEDLSMYGVFVLHACVILLAIAFKALEAYFHCLRQLRVRVFFGFYPQEFLFFSPERSHASSDQERRNFSLTFGRRTQTTLFFHSSF
jgi:hypothetical protein